MPRTAENLVRHELIGLRVKVKGSTDPGRKGFEGKVIDETENTLEIDTGEKEVRVPKDESTFLFELDDKKVSVEGDLLVGRPEKRILKKLPRKWEYTD